MSTAEPYISEWSMSGELHKPNWLLRGLIFLSVGIHLLLFMQMPRLDRARDISRIELTLKQISSPFERQVPKPRSRLKPLMEMHEPIQPEELHALSYPMKPLQYTMPKAVDPNSLTGKKKIPRIPIVEDTTVAEWQAEPETLSGSMTPPGKKHVMTERAYTHLVQKQIEAVKQYPKRAQRRNEQGVVEMIFTIGNDGEIVSQNIIKSSGSRILDGAAMDALKKASPFARPPNGPIVIQLPIRFELLK
jgi:periplasmic protein TonB